MSKILTINKPRSGDWQGLMVALSDIERDINRALPYIFDQASIADGQYLTRSGKKIVGAVPPGGGLAPATASYIVVSLDGALSAERTLGAATPLQLVDTGANGSATVGFPTQGPNTILAGPTTGGAATPSFRGLVSADIPNLDTAKITTGLMTQARLGTGSVGGGAKFLADDQTYKAVTASVAFTTAEVSLGAAPLARRSGRVQITGLAGLTIGKPVYVQQAAGPYTGKGTRADEAEMDRVNFVGYVTAADKIDLFWQSQTRVRGNFKVNYLVGA